MSALEMEINLLEIQREELAFWQVRKFVGVCTLLDPDWLEKGNIVNFTLDLENATKMMENAITFMIPPKLQSAQSF